MQNNNNLWYLVARNLCKEATEEENEKLNKMLEEDPCLKFSLDVLTNFWQSVNDENAETAKKSLDRHIQRLQRQNAHT
jgi:hypothetical protein